MDNTILYDSLIELGILAGADDLIGKYGGDSREVISFIRHAAMGFDLAASSLGTDWDQVDFNEAISEFYAVESAKFLAGK